MALQSDAIESRLLGLRQEDRRPLTESKMWRRHEGNPPALPPDRAPRPPGRDGDEISTERIVSLLEDIMRRIDGLENAERASKKEVRRQARRDSIWRIFVTASGIVAVAVLAGRWLVDFL